MCIVMIIIIIIIITAVAVVVVSRLPSWHFGGRPNSLDTRLSAHVDLFVVFV